MDLAQQVQQDQQHIAHLQNQLAAAMQLNEQLQEEAAAAEEEPLEDSAPISSVNQSHPPPQDPPELSDDESVHGAPHAQPGVPQIGREPCGSLLRGHRAVCHSCGGCVRRCSMTRQVGTSYQLVARVELTSTKFVFSLGDHAWERTVVKYTRLGRCDVYDFVDGCKTTMMPHV